MRPRQLATPAKADCGMKENGSDPVPAQELPGDPIDSLLLDNATLEAWRICYLANNYLFPLYRFIEKQFNITRPEWSSLFCLAHEEPLCAQDVANKTGQPKNSIIRGVNLLVKKGLIEKTEDPGDGRRSLLSITRKGWKLYGQILPTAVSRKERLISPLSAKELEQLNHLLLKLCANIDERMNSHD